MIRKYGIEDIQMWKEWLVYGTALGVGDVVMEAMSEMEPLMQEETVARNVMSGLKGNKKSKG